MLSGIAVEAMTAMTAPPPVARPVTAAAMEKKLRSVLKEVSGSLFEQYKPLGIGEDWRYEGKLSIGKALFCDGDLVHFSAFGK
jgi:hypothetical protein